MTEHTLRDRIEQLSAYRVLFTLKFSPIISLTIAKNIQMLLTEINPFEEAKKGISKIEGLEEYEKKRVAICEEYCAKTPEGAPAVHNNGYIFPTKEIYALADVQIQALNKEYPNVLEEKEHFDFEINVLLDSPVAVPLLEIDLSSCKEEIAPAVLFPLLGHIKEPWNV